MSYGTRESPYPSLGADGQPVEQYIPAPAAQQQHYAPPPTQHYAPPPSQPYQAPHAPSHAQPMMHSQNYAAPPQGAQSQGYYQGQQEQQMTGYGAGGQGKMEQNYNYGNKTEKYDQIKPKWNDLIFALLFIAQLGAFIAIAVISLRALPASQAGIGRTGGTSLTLDRSTAYLLAIIAGAGLVFSIVLLLIVRAFTKIILEITLLLSVVLSVAYAVYMWYLKYWSGAIIFTIFAIFSIIAYFPMRRRIPLSRELLIFVLKIAKHYPSVYVLALIGTLVQTIWSVFWSFAIVAIYQKWSPQAAGSDTSVGTASNGALIGLVVFAIFSYYYTSQFILNYFLVIISGIYGTYYFEGPGTKHTALGAFKRASTYSLGSIAFGSLICAIIDTIRAILQIARGYARQEGDAISAAIICCVDCCLGCVQYLVEFFNRLGMIEIALYGKPYVQACKDTWNLVKDRGIDALINECLVNNIWTFGSFAVGALCSAFAFIYLTVSNPSYVQDGSSIRAVVMGYAFIIGFMICHTLGYGALSSGVSTIFVGLAENPEVLAERSPALFEMIRRAYPKVVMSV